MDDNFRNEVISLWKENKWEEILKLNANSDSEVARNLLWVWPSESNLKFIKNYVQKFDLEKIVSIGCGCGLFEWILQEYSRIPIIGYEINEEWWNSKYSNPQFINLQYPEQPLCENGLNSSVALLFCYFNNGPAFIDYIDNYCGNLVFIIGPGPGRGTHTDPQPFKANFGDTKWTLLDSQEVKNTKDFIAVYTRDINNNYLN